MWNPNFLDSVNFYINLQIILGFWLSLYPGEGVAALLQADHCSSSLASFGAQLSRQRRKLRAQTGNKKPADHLEAARLTIAMNLIYRFLPEPFPGLWQTRG